MRKECELHHTPARDNQYRATARYYVDSCPYCKIEQLQSQLHLLAKAVLEAHKGKGHCIDCPHVEYGEDYQRCKGGEYDCCKCTACKVAREVGMNTDDHDMNESECAAYNMGYQAGLAKVQADDDDDFWLRQYAGQAMQGLLVGVEEPRYRNIASMAVKQALALLEEVKRGDQ